MVKVVQPQETTMNTAPRLRNSLILSDEDLADMNPAQRARFFLRLSAADFALLLGVSESAIILAEGKQDDALPSVSDELYRLIEDDPRGYARKFLEHRTSCPLSGDDRHRIAAIAAQFRKAQII
jgi:DNA-binding transcriptional regulator YiaG